LILLNPYNRNKYEEMLKANWAITPN
jgi:hypothetical protein